MTASIDVTQLRAALEALSQGGNTPSETPAELANRFQSLMQTAHLESPATPDYMQIASKALAIQDVEMQRIPDDMQAFREQLTTMSLTEMTEASMTLMMDMSTAQLDLSAKMGVAQSSKSAIETLMKNQ